MNLREGTRRLVLLLGIVVAAHMACVGCQSRSHAPVQSTSASHPTPQANPASKVDSAPESKATPKPELFGFQVTSVLPEVCCSDVPGKPIPDGSTSVEGVTPDNVRFALSCLPDSYKDYDKQPGRISKAVRDKWYESHTASIKSGQYQDRMTIYNFDGEAPDYWKPFAECSVYGRIERARDEFQILVLSSNAGDWKNGSGYELFANSNTETFALRCIQNAQSPCVSIAPATYRGIRDGSEVRLCDQDLKVIGTFQIISERSLR